MSKKFPFNEFKGLANKKYDNRFIYDESTYNGSHQKMRIICPEHGEFWQEPRAHLKYMFGCPACSYEYRAQNNTSNTEEFIEKARKIHGNKYDYSKVNYISVRDKVCIICPKHGEFWQVPNYHLNGEACPMCSESHLEKEFENVLLKNNILFEKQKTFSWLGKQSLDFYLPEYNTGIECQGKQHFGFGGWNLDNYDKQLLLDEKKFIKCKENNIKLIYIIPKTIKKENIDIWFYSNENTFYVSEFKINI